MQKSNLIKQIEDNAPLGLQALWDFSGIQIESIREEFSHIAVMLDPTLETIEQAISLGADFILTHHPLSLSPYNLGKSDALFAIVQKLISNNVLLYSAHTSLDANFGGFSSWLASDLNLQNISELDLAEHFGVIGNLEKAISLDELYNKLLQSMPFISKNDFRLVGKNLAKEEILGLYVQRIAFCTGSGSGMYPIAREQGADIFITGDVKYHTALDISTDISSSSMLLLDVGHFSLEEEMMRRFSKYLESTLEIQVSFISSKNPFITIN